MSYGTPSFQPDSTLRCHCGYDLLHPCGYDDDNVGCETCTFTAGGAWAEHAGVHHWLDTGHHWYLHRRNTT